MAFAPRFSAFRAKKIVPFELHKEIWLLWKYFVFFATGALLTESSAELEVPDKSQIICKAKGSLRLH